MNERLRWWVLPGAIVVLLRVVTLGDAGTATSLPVTALDASENFGTVAVLDAAGRRTPPVVVPALVAAACVLRVPERHCGRRGELVLWRRIDGRRENSPWLTLRPRVLADATIKIAGLGAGSYDVEFRCEGELLTADQATVPGSIELRPLVATPAR
jgi:hypothetical protein